MSIIEEISGIDIPNDITDFHNETLEQLIKKIETVFEIPPKRLKS